MGHEVPPEEPVEYGADCRCFDAGKTPLHYTIVLSGVQTCGGGAHPANGVHILTQDSGPGCRWVYRGDEPDLIGLRLALADFTLNFYYHLMTYFGHAGEGCLVTATDIPNAITDCGLEFGTDGIGGSASWCPGYHPRGCK